MGSGEFYHEYELEKLQTITPKNREFKMLVTPRYLHHYVENVYEDFSSELLLNLSKETSLFIDIGAHHGFYTLLIGTKFKESKIIAFEPVPENYEILKRNVQLNNLRNIELFNLAVSNRQETKIMNVSEGSDSCGFYPHPLAKTLKTIEVKTVSLDHFLKDIGTGSILIKIDTEGHELYVLEGMTNTLKNTEDIKLLIEFNPKLLRIAGYQPEDLLKKLDQLDFDIYLINDDQRKAYKLTENKFKNWSIYLGEGNFKKDYSNIFCIKKTYSLSVCFFSHSSQLLGAERSLLELITELIRDHGVICSVVLPNNGPLREKLEQVGASTLIADYSWWCDISSPPDQEIRSRLNNSFETIFKHIKQELDKINPDVFFTNTMVIPWGAAIAFFLGKPHVWFIREFGKLDHGFKFYLPFQDILKIIKNSSNLIFTNSNAVRESLFKKGFHKNILTIYPYIDLPSKVLCKNENNYFTRTNATKLIIAGNISETKGQEDAIMAVKELIERKKDVELIIMGPSVSWYLKALKDMVRDKNLVEYVKFFNFMEDHYSVVNDADIVLVCSRNEAFGRTTLEAMLLKKPVIGSKSGGTPELIKEGFNGLLYEPGDYKQLTNKIEYFIENKKKIKEFGENGYKFANENFTKEKYGGKVYALLKDLKGTENPSSSPFLSFFLKRIMDNLLNFEAVIKDKTAHIENLETTIKEKGEEILQLQNNIESMIREKDNYIKDLEVNLEAKEKEISRFQGNAESMIKEKDQYIDSVKEALDMKDEYVRALEANLKAKGEEILQLQNNIESMIREKDNYIKDLEVNLEAKEKEISRFQGNAESMIKEKEEYIKSLNASKAYRILKKVKFIDGIKDT